MSQADERLLKEFEDKDAVILALSDAFDVKASIVLLLATFLATETVYLFEKHLSSWSFVSSMAASLFLIVALMAAVVSLWPRTYIYPDPESTSSRIIQLESAYGQFEGWTVDVEEIVLSQLTIDQIAWCRGRIANNQRKNRSKARWLNSSFYATAFALFFSLGTLVAISHLF